MSTDTAVLPEHRTLTADELPVYRLMLEEQWRNQVGDLAELSYDALSDTDGRDDDGRLATDRLINSQLVAAARQQLSETEAALARIDDGTYGVCGSCGQPISPERLEILPAAPLCVACQSRRAAR